MVKDTRNVDRRTVLKKAGLGIGTPLTVGVTTAPAKGSEIEKEDDQDPDDAEPDAITSSSVWFDDNPIDVSDTTIINCEWEKGFGIPCDWYNVETFIERVGLNRPQTVEEPFSPDWDWEEWDGGGPLTSPGYHWGAEWQWLCYGTHTMRAVIDPESSGEYEAYTGAFVPGASDYTNATLIVE